MPFNIIIIISSEHWKLRHFKDHLFWKFEGVEWNLALNFLGTIKIRQTWLKMYFKIGRSWGNEVFINRSLVLDLGKVYRRRIFLLLKLKFQLLLNLFFEIWTNLRIIDVFLLLRHFLLTILWALPVFLYYLNVFNPFKILFITVASVWSPEIKCYFLRGLCSNLPLVKSKSKCSFLFLPFTLLFKFELLTDSFVERHPSLINLYDRFDLISKLVIKNFLVVLILNRF